MKLSKFLSNYEEETIILNGLLLIAAFAFLTSCSLIDDDLSDCPKNQSGKVMLTLNVTPEEWGNTSSTRATYSSASASGGNMTFSFSFDEGDAIGMFVIDKTGKVIKANQKYTYSGGAWTTETPIEYEAGLGAYSFFAYYPWQSSLSGAPAVDASVDATSVSTFFGSAISAWTPSVDQSSLQKFTACDLMMAKGTTNTPYFHEIQVSFTLAHQMGLLITKDVLSYYRLGNPSETWTETQTFSPNIPYSIGDLRYYLAKPDTPTTLGSKTTTVDAGQVEQLYFTNGEPVE